MTHSVLHSEEAIAARVSALAKKIAHAPLLPDIAMPILVGGFIFAADLVRALAREGVELEIEMLWLRSYGDKRVALTQGSSVVLEVDAAGVVHLGGPAGQLVALAALVMIGTREIFRDFQEYSMLVFGIALVVVMVVRPRGLISGRTPSVSLGKHKQISADLVSQGHG